MVVYYALISIQIQNEIQKIKFIQPIEKERERKGKENKDRDVKMNEMNTKALIEHNYLLLQAIWIYSCSEQKGINSIYRSNNTI